MIEDAAVRILATLDWHRRRKFMPQSQLKRWAHMVRGCPGCTGPCCWHMLSSYSLSQAPECSCDTGLWGVCMQVGACCREGSWVWMLVLPSVAVEQQELELHQLPLMSCITFLHSPLCHCEPSVMLGQDLIWPSTRIGPALASSASSESRLCRPETRG